MSNRKLAVIMVTAALIVMLVLLMSACNPDRIDGHVVEDEPRFVCLKDYQYDVNGYNMGFFEDTVTGILYMVGPHWLSPLMNTDGSPVTREEFIQQEDKRLNLR